ncbi:uracil-DNA glycosylase [Chitinivibrio alkaliphilus]|uniref:Uracil-DNA glycosylase n=1 Tax=Chitinivibrio alkaliphilus ACht1 TaxID=1313304 RepID=U7DAX3_9BACT|nr:uracil-DNA glycosylase [Chitinivibrio alkaliphilus]ERP31555.1 uracil DNA glycosylase [Chitinivibrio alkaliphilus ACht1]
MTPLTDLIPPAWSSYFAPFEEELQNIDAVLSRSEETIFPEREKIFTAFEETPPHFLRAILIGQDPYHGPGQAHGLAFSVPFGEKYPPSLRNIFKEYAADLSLPMPTSTDLTPWAHEGVLLLNTCLTVSAEKAHSHRGIGWEELLQKVVYSIAEAHENLVFLLWGNHAQRFSRSLPLQKHSVLTAPHPSPLSAYRGFFGSRPFSQTNRILQQYNHSPIQWKLP